MVCPLLIFQMYERQQLDDCEMGACSVFYGRHEMHADLWYVLCLFFQCCANIQIVVSNNMLFDIRFEMNCNIDTFQSVDRAGEPR